MNFPTYPNYKHSGTEWLGAVPEHWRVVPVKFILNSTKAGPFGSSLTKDMYATSGYRVYGQEQVIPNDFSVGDYFITPEKFEELREYSISPRDVLVSCVGTFGRIAIVPTNAAPGIINPRLIRLRCSEEVEPEYLAEVMRSDFIFQQFASLTRGGTMDVINIGTLKELIIAIPPLQEQQDVLAGVQEEVGQIEALMEEQRRLIELLKEKRQAVISHAVTKGLNPDASMRPSGVDWLGDVPSHWEIGAIKRFFSVLDGRRVPLSSEERALRPGQFPYYGASGVIDSIDEFIFDEDLILVSEDGANLLNRSTPIAFVARGRYWVNNHAHILKPLDDALTYWAERIETINLTPVITGSAQPKLTIEALLNLRIAVPPSGQERLAIQNYVVYQSGKLDRLLDEATKAIDLLQERRSALISAAVTGKIDVRQAVAEGVA
jgi:type I restriction enzyme S subunit